MVFLSFHTVSEVGGICQNENMTAKQKHTTNKSTIKNDLEKQVQTVLTSLRRRSSKRTREEMGPRYGVFTDKAFGVKMADIQQVAKQVGRNHELAAALWKTGWYEARMLTAFIEEPELVTSAQMDRWCRDFDNWGICDTLCFHLFDLSPYAFGKVVKWSKSREEFVKRAAFALLACLALHDKKATDEQFKQCLPLIERAASDERNFVKKGVSWALRLVGRRNFALNQAAVELSRRLAAADEQPARWIGKAALKELTNPVLVKKLEARAASLKEKKSRASLLV
jgi:3-methyladenine DNA glycosylase AlkD